MSYKIWPLFLTLLRYCLSFTPHRSLQPLLFEQRDTVTPRGGTKMTQIGFENEIAAFGIVVVDTGLDTWGPPTAVFPNKVVARTTARTGPWGSVSKFEITYDMGVAYNTLEMISGPRDATWDKQKDALNAMVKFANAVEHEKILCAAWGAAYGAGLNPAGPGVVGCPPGITHVASLTQVINRYNPFPANQWTLVPQPLAANLQVWILVNGIGFADSSPQTNFGMKLRNFVPNVAAFQNLGAPTFGIAALPAIIAAVQASIAGDANLNPLVGNNESEGLFALIRWTFDVRAYGMSHLLGNPSQTKDAFGIMPKDAMQDALRHIEDPAARAAIHAWWQANGQAAGPGWDAALSPFFCDQAVALLNHCDPLLATELPRIFEQDALCDARYHNENSVAGTYGLWYETAGLLANQAPDMHNNPPNGGFAIAGGNPQAMFRLRVGHNDYPGALVMEARRGNLRDPIRISRNGGVWTKGTKAQIVGVITEVLNLA